MRQQWREREGGERRDGGSEEEMVNNVNESSSSSRRGGGRGRGYWVGRVRRTESEEERESEGREVGNRAGKDLMGGSETAVYAWQSLRVHTSSQAVPLIGPRMVRWVEGEGGAWRGAGSGWG